MKSERGSLGDGGVRVLDSLSLFFFFVKRGLILATGFPAHYITQVVSQKPRGISIDNEL